jgi:hypothetical protein
MGIRDTIPKITPAWLNGFVGTRFLYSMGLVLDAVYEKAHQGVLARFPGLGTPTALPAIGADRQIDRGFAETDDSYIARLIGFRKTWAFAGNALTLIKQFIGYTSPVAVPIKTVNIGGNWWTYDGAGNYLHHNQVPPNWNWDGHPEVYWRGWIILYPPPTLWKRPPVLGTGGVAKLGQGGPTGFTLGSTATSSQVAGLRQLANKWKDQGSIVPNIILAFDAAFAPEFLPPSSSGLPDGSWGAQSKLVAGVQVRSRDPRAVYLSGSVQFAYTTFAGPPAYPGAGVPVPS